MDHHELEDGVSYIFSEKLPIGSYRAFRLHLERGYEGLCITEVEPTALRERLKFNVPVIRVAKGEYPEVGVIAPHRLPKLSMTVAEFLKSKGRKKKVIILDCLGYLLANNDFVSIMRFLQLINEYIMINNAVLIMPLNLKNLDGTKAGFLDRELTVLKETDLAARFVEPRSTLKDKSDSA